MIICAINLSGNTGKTTLSKHLMVPLTGASRIQIEDVNTGDGVADVEIAAKKFSDLAAELNMAADEQNFIIDIGASNAKLMFEKFEQLKLTRNLVDFWVVPAVPGSKQVTDTARTVAALIKIGIPPKKIVVILNKVQDREEVSRDFDALFQMATGIGIHVIAEPIMFSEAFERLKNEKDTVFSIASETPDFAQMKADARASGDAKRMHDTGQRMVLQDQCESTAENLRAVFMMTPIAVQFRNSLSTLLSAEAA